MNKQIFGDLDHRLSVVKRWGIAHTIQSQSVAEHVFNVERIAVRIAKHWFNIQDPQMLFAVARCAHHHDDHEALMGDPPTMIKPYLDEEAFEKEHADLIPLPDFHPTAKRIVKLADMLEGYHFLCVEEALGNKYMERHKQFEPERVMAWVYEQFPFNQPLYDLVKDTMRSMENPRSTRYSMRGR